MTEAQETALAELPSIESGDQLGSPIENLRIKIQGGGFLRTAMRSYLKKWYLLSDTEADEVMDAYKGKGQ